MTTPTLREALAELVALREMEEAIEKGPHPRAIEANLFQRLKEDYAHRKPLAWAAARRVLALTAPEQSPADGGQLRRGLESLALEIDCEEVCGHTVAASIRDLLATPAAPTSGEPWRPIETAPKDAVILLGFSRWGHHRLDRRVYEGRWHDGQQAWTSVNGFIVLTGVDFWMPLPAAPGATPPSAAQAEGASVPAGWKQVLLEVAAEYATFEERPPSHVLEKVRKRLAALTAAPEKLEGPNDWEPLKPNVQLVGAAPHKQAAQPEKLAPAPQQAGQAVAWANFRHDPPSYVPYRTEAEAQASVERSRIAATQEGPFSVVPLYPPSPQQAAQGGERKEEHVCGARGFGLGLDDVCPRCEQQKRERAARAAQGGREGLTDEQRRNLWRESSFRGNGGQIDWFIEGTKAAERYYGITTPSGDSAASQGGSGGGA